MSRSAAHAFITNLSLRLQPQTAAVCTDLGCGLSGCAALLWSITAVVPVASSIGPNN